MAFVRVWLWAFCLPSLALAAGQHTTFLELAPAPKWQVVDSHPLNLNNLSRWGGEPEVDREYGVKSAEIRTYSDGERTVQALVEAAPDPSAAYGLLTFYQNAKTAPIKGMKLTVAAQDEAFMARGRAFIRVRRPGKPPIRGEAFRKLLSSIGGGEAPSRAAMALLPPLLPPEGLVPGSVKYILGPVAGKRALPFFPLDLVGFRQGAELQAGSYRQRKGNANLFLISYPTPQIAELRFEAFTRVLGLNQGHGPQSFYGRRKETYLLLVQNATSKAAASKLMDQLSISQIVSWDQPYPTGKPVTVQMYHLLVGNILLVLLLVSLAVAAGLLLFVSRKLAARLFPESEWAHSYEGSIIQLNLK